MHLLIRGDALSTSRDVTPSPNTMAHRVLLRQPDRKGSKGTRFGIWTLDVAFLMFTSGETRHLCYTLPQRSSSGCWQCNIQVDTQPCLNGKPNCNVVFVVTFGKQRGCLTVALVRMHFSGNWFTQQLQHKNGGSNLDLKRMNHVVHILWGAQEDVLHCIWDCEISRSCWGWGEFILRLASLSALDNVGDNARLSLAHVLIILPLLEDWGIPG